MDGIKEKMKLAHFEKISTYKDIDIKLPIRKTTGSAGYDFFVAEDIIIPPYNVLWDKLAKAGLDADPAKEIYNLDQMAALTKTAIAKPTLVPTGIKCQLDKGTYLELSVRSSCPLKYWLVLANSIGIIDSDYYNNEDNEGHIYFQMINLSPFSIRLLRGDCIGQGIIKPYLFTDDDKTNGERNGGFGSTDLLQGGLLPA